MIKEALEYFAGLVGEPQTQVGDRPFIKEGYKELFPPVPVKAALHTLTSFVEFIKLEEQRDEVFIHVASPSSVALLGALTDQQTRKVYALASPMINGSFSYQDWMDQEKFVTDAQAFFDDSPDTDKAALLKVIGNIRNEASQTLEDDGVTQKVTTAKGVVQKAVETLPNPVKLMPFEGFPELVQPIRQFVVRMRSGGENYKPVFALFPVPNPVASQTACEEIKTWLTASLPPGFIGKVLG